MKKASFDAAKLALKEACELLRTFTLARNGSTKKGGITAIDRVSDLCDQMDKLFAKVADAGKARTLVAAARPQILAAKARLALLQKPQ